MSATISPGQADLLAGEQLAPRSTVASEALEVGQSENLSGRFGTTYTTRRGVYSDSHDPQNRHRGVGAGGDGCFLNRVGHMGTMAA